MTQPLVLASRYRLDDPSVWLEGVDPSHNYWIYVNGCPEMQVVIPGLIVSSVSELKTAIQNFRSLNPGETMKVERIVGGCTIHCIGVNCYAIEGRVQGALVWHLFDRESLESLLMTSHPDWIPSPQDMAIGRRLLMQAFTQPVYAH